MRYARNAVAIAAAMSLLLGAACSDDADDESGDATAPTAVEDTTADSDDESGDATAPTAAPVEDTTADSDDQSVDTTAPTDAAVEGGAVLEPVAEDGDDSAHAEGKWSLVASGDAAVMDLNDVVAGGPGFVAVGADENFPAVWTSVDGVTWTRATDVPETGFGGPGFGGMLAVGGGDPGFVATKGAGPFGGGRAPCGPRRTGCRGPTSAIATPSSVTMWRWLI